MSSNPKTLGSIPWRGRVSDRFFLSSNPKTLGSIPWRGREGEGQGSFSASPSQHLCSLVGLCLAPYAPPPNL